MACSFLGQFLENIKGKDNMASDNKTTIQVGGGFCNILFFILLVLKLTGNFPYSWWLVTAPLWGPLALVLGIEIIFVIGFLLYGLVSEINKQLKR